MTIRIAQLNIQNTRPIQSGTVYLMDEVMTASAALTSWQDFAIKDLSSRLDDARFPCLFALKAWKKGSIRFAFAGNDGAGLQQNALAALTDYTNFVHAVPQYDRLLCPLLLFFKITNNEYRPLYELGWEILNRLHEKDPASWPGDVPLSPDTPEWSFCFNGIQLFINMSSPEHVVLKSRKLGRYLVFVINPRENFDRVASQETRSGRLVRQNIRNRVELYNGVAAPADLGFFGSKDNREWRQYHLVEPGLDGSSVCPFRGAAHNTPEQKPVIAAQSQSMHHATDPTQLIPEKQSD